MTAMESPATPFPAEIPVLIVGAGPVGMAVAAELGRAGVDCLIVEQGDGTLDHPRASAINSRTMEFCRRWGIADEVRAVGTPADYPHTSLVVTSLRGFEIARIDRPTHGGGGAPLPHTPERPQRCNQIWFNPVLRDVMASQDSVDFRLNCRLEAIAPTPKGWRATVTDLARGVEQTVDARFVVAGCGGRSVLPETIGVRLGDDTILSHSINIFFRSPALWSLHDKGKAALTFFIGADGLWGGMAAQDGNAFWRLTLHGGKDYIDPASVDAEAALLRMFGGDFAHETLNVVPWARREWVADRFQQGGLFLAGDAAHQLSPSGGFGMNTGMGDAIDLGWKLAATIAGWGGAGLADSYEGERRPVALRNVGEAADNFRRYEVDEISHIERPGATGDAQRAALGETFRRTLTRQTVTDGIALGYRYEGSPICLPDGDAPPPDDPGIYTPSSHAGCRAPHGWLEDGRSVLDLFGDGFVLLRLGRAPPDPGALVRAAAARRLPLIVETRGEPALAALYGRALVLVRPDGHVAWRGNETPGDALHIIDTVRGAV
ncbi:MAG: FAD-dependent monooxygenase [Alphaproteobacteria bacterium]